MEQKSDTAAIQQRLAAIPNCELKLGLRLAGFELAFVVGDTASFRRGDNWIHVHPSRRGTGWSAMPPLPSMPQKSVWFEFCDALETAIHDVHSAQKSNDKI